MDGHQKERELNELSIEGEENVEVSVSQIVMMEDIEEGIDLERGEVNIPRQFYEPKALMADKKRKMTP